METRITGLGLCGLPERIRRSWHSDEEARIEGNARVVRVFIHAYNDSDNDSEVIRDREAVGRTGCRTGGSRGDDGSDDGSDDDSDDDSDIDSDNDSEDYSDGYSGDWAWHRHPVLQRLAAGGLDSDKDSDHDSDNGSDDD